MSWNKLRTLVPSFQGAFLQTEQEEVTNTEKILFSCYTLHM